MLYLLLTLVATAAARVGGEYVRLVSDGPVMLDAPIVFTGRSAERKGGGYSNQVLRPLKPKETGPSLPPPSHFQGG